MTGAEIKAMREALGLTQGELARKVGAKSFTTISRWECEVSKPLGIFENKLKRLARQVERMDKQ